MTPNELLRAGDLDGAMAALSAQVRGSPADAKLRIFLFQLLCISGEWKRAVTQLKVSAELDPAAKTMAQMYREAIICEVFREKVFAGDKTPMIFGEPQDWMALMVEALKAVAHGRTAEAAGLRARAFDMAPATGGTLNETTFDWIGDADMRLGPMLEMIINGKYYWMPFASIGTLRLEAPVDLRDLVWTPGHLTLANGGEMVVLVPTRYPGTTASGSAAARLARVTDWVDAGHDTWCGLGPRLLATDAGDTPIMEVRSLRMNAAATGQGSDV